MTQAVRDIILKPMCELYQPPPHLRDADGQARALAAYETALAPFDRDTLQRAWENVVARQSHWVWPNPRTLVEACRKCQPKPAPPSDEQQRQATALQMADDYASHFMKTSHLAKLAARDGWSGRLRDYVTDAASVQAQLLCGVRNIGWNAKLAEDLGRFHSSAEAFAAYRNTIEKHVEHGEIRVDVPPSRIQQWQEKCRPDQERSPAA